MSGHHLTSVPVPAALLVNGAPVRLRDHQAQTITAVRWIQTPSTEAHPTETTTVLVESVDALEVRTTIATGIVEPGGGETSLDLDGHQVIVGAGALEVTITTAGRMPSGSIELTRRS